MMFCNKKTATVSDEVVVVSQPKPKQVQIEKARSERNVAKEKEQRLLQDWQLPSRYQIIRTLGAGAYGTVVQAKDHDNNRLVAIKQNKHLFDELIDSKRILREIAILAQLDHPHIVKLYDVVVPVHLTKFNEIYAVIDLAESDLAKLLRADVCLNHGLVHTLLYNLLVGLLYLHGSCVMHRDLKPANCLVNEDCSVQICDFGLARAFGKPAMSLDKADDPEKRRLTGHVVTRWYRAPELILLQESYTEAIDVWSVACIFAELMGMLEGQPYCQRAPLFPGSHCFPLSPSARHGNDARFHSSSPKEQLGMICELLGAPSKEDFQQIQGHDARRYMSCFANKEGKGVRAAFSDIDPAGTDLLEKMLVFSPSRRITAQSAVMHNIFSGFRNLALELKKPAKVSLDFEVEEVLDKRCLRALFIREVKRFHPDVPELQDVAAPQYPPMPKAGCWWTLP